MPRAATRPALSREPSGLALWMNRVLEECDHASIDFGPKPVHDLRVALRRCRSVADGIMAIAPHPAWKGMKKAGRELFRSLGALRDVHIMQEWTQQLGASEDGVTSHLLTHLLSAEAQSKHAASTALANFDRKQWKKWSSILPRRAARLRPGTDVFKHLALERWTQARQLHRQALRNRSKVAFHRLRVGLKRLRYIVENFLPDQHAAWSDDLKAMQDLLGEVHDLDVLWAEALKVNPFATTMEKSAWQAKIVDERLRRIAKYREKMVGRDSLWQLWRAQLPQGKEVRLIAFRRLKLWASVLDPDVHHSNLVTRLAVQLYDGLPKKTGRSSTNFDERSILQLAGVLHEVGRGKKEKRSQKATFKLIDRLDPPLGWTSEEMYLTAVIGRYHQGPLPRRGQRFARRLRRSQRQMVLRLAGILRLADALDANRHSQISSLQIESHENVLVIKAEGYSPRNRLAEHIAGARHLLEDVLGQPILVMPDRVAPDRRVGTRRLRK